MKKSVQLIAACMLLASCSTTPTETPPRYTDYVDPFIGTGGHGHVFLGANVPFGFVQLGPSQPTQGWDWTSGYHYSDSVIAGFSHTHLSGTGIGDLGDITFMPHVEADYALSPFSHDRETARPGYYKVHLDRGDIDVELTATPRAGLHRYTFPAGADTVYVTADTKFGIGWDKAVETAVKVVNDSTIEGYRLSTGWAKDHRVYFTTVFSTPIVGETLTDDGILRIAFAPEGDVVEARTGLSAVSAANAARNLEAETAGKDFDTVTAQADEAWNTQLAKIKVETDNETDLRKFYTAMYHFMTAPVLFSDINGDYLGSDGQTHSTSGEFDNHSIFSLWDTYRAAHPLATLILPEKQKDYARTFINIYRQQGKLPVWHLHGNETDCMIGNPGVIVLADLTLKGFVDDPEEAYEAMKASMLLDERSLGDLNKYGYVPYDGEQPDETVAKGLEYAIAFDAVARVARKLGKTDDAEKFGKLGASYKEYFDPSLRFMRGKSKKGEFRVEDYNPFFATHRADDYCEGNGWQYVWLAPQDPHGLIELFGSEEAFVAKLDSLFTVEGSLGDDASPDISGLIGQYAHGNEPGHHTIYLYNYAGQPAKSAKLLRRVMDHMYHAEPDGLCGNEDVGQMSAWYILSSLGLYQVEPAGGKFVFGTPLFRSATIDTGNGRTLTVKAPEVSEENIYVESVLLDGEPYDKGYIDFDRLRQGGVLEFVMTPNESSTFATSHEARP